MVIPHNMWEKKYIYVYRFFGQKLNLQGAFAMKKLNLRNNGYPHIFVNTHMRKLFSIARRKCTNIYLILA